MQLIQEKHKSTGKDVTIKIPLSANANLGGLQESINDYIERETGLSINGVTDGETFRYLRNVSKTFQFEFYNGFTYTTSLLNAGFTQNEISAQSDSLTDSFYIFQIYDSTNRQNQTLLHNSYYNGTSITSLNTTYTIPVNNEFSNAYIPKWFIDGNLEDTIEVYGSFLFYNAKTGKLQVFFNKNNETLTTDDKMYYTITINKSNKTYSFNGSDGSTIRLKELSNIDYVNRINESLNSFDNEIPRFPVGDKFNSDGTYETVT